MRKGTCMKRSATPSFILTIPMRCRPGHTKYLDKIFRAAGNMYNNLISDRKKALAQMEHTREWKKLQGKIVKILSEKQETLTGDGAKLLELAPLAQDIQKKDFGASTGRWAVPGRRQTLRFLTGMGQPSA